MSKSTKANIAVLHKEIGWLKDIIAKRADLTGNEEEVNEIDLSNPPVFESTADSSYALFVSENKLNGEERLVLILALSSVLDPNIFNYIFEDKKMKALFKVIGSSNGISVIPTGETALFLLSGLDMEKRVDSTVLFEPEHLFYKNGVIEFQNVSPGESILNGILKISKTYHDWLVFGKFKKPRFSEEFPAHLLETPLEWEDLFLMPFTRGLIEETKAYLDEYESMRADKKLKKQLKEGCRILLYGDTGTGKTLTAALLGKYLNRDVYRVDISTVSSKYIGDTQKRINSLLNTAERKGWIIFFDEGDALLGQRQSGGDSGNTHYANQDVAFLLQRMEDYNGILIVATNLRGNIDQAFLRRFQASVKFSGLDENLQRQFWDYNLPDTLKLASDSDLPLLIKRHPLSPASIINVIIRSSVITFKDKSETISRAVLERCIRDEELKYAGRQSFAN